MSSHRKSIDSAPRGRTMTRDQRKYSGIETSSQIAPVAGPSDSETAPIPAFAPYGYPQPQQPSRSSYGNAPPPQKSSIQQQPLPPAPQLGSSPPLPKSLTQKPLAQQSSRQPPPSGPQQPHPTQQQPSMPYPYPQPFPDPRLQGFPGAPPPPGFVPAGGQFPQPFQYISYPPQHYGVPPPFATGPAPSVTPHHLQSPYSAVPPNVYPPPSFQTGGQIITPQARPPTAPESKKPRRPRSRNSNSSGSSTSSSLLNVSRVSHPKGEPTEKGFFKRFFTAGSQKKARRRRRSQRRRHVAGMPNSSSSSLTSDLAYGYGYVDRSSESSGSESDTTRQTHHPQYMYPSIPYVASPYGPQMYYAAYPIPAPLPGQHPYGHSRHPSGSTNHTQAGTAMAAGAVAGAVGGAMFNHLTSTSASTTIVNQQRSGGSTPKGKKPKDKKGKQKARPRSGDGRKTLNDSPQIDSKLMGLQKQLEHLLTATQEYDSATSQRRELLRNGSQGVKSNGKDAAHFTRPHEDSNSEWEDADGSESDSGSASSSSDGLAYGRVIPIPVKTSTQAYNTRGSELPYYSHSNNPSNQAGFRRTSARSSYSQSELSSNVNVPLQQPRPTHPLGSNIFDLRSPPENKPSRTGTSGQIAPIGIVTGAIGATLAAKAFSESQEVKKKTATQTSYESSKAENSFSGYGRQEGDGRGRPYSSGKEKAVEPQHVLERPQPHTVKYDAHAELSSKISGKITRSTDSRMNPFQYQVPHDAFKTPHSSPPQAPNRYIQENETASKTKLAATVIAPAAAVTTAAYLLSKSRSSKTEKRTRVEEVTTTERSTEVPALPPRIVPKPEGQGLAGYKASHTPESIRYPLKSAMKGGTAVSLSRSSTSSPRAVSIAPSPSSREVKERTETTSLACVTKHIEQKSERATQELHERDIRIAQEEAKKMKVTHEAKRAAQEAHGFEVRIAREEEERLKAARRAEQAAHEALVAERLAKEARDCEARERAERAEAERSAKEAYDREARRKAEKFEAERIAKKTRDREAKERAERLEAERAANEATAKKAAREARDREARVALEEARKAESLREKMEAERIAIEAERAAQRAREAEEAITKRAAQEALEAERAAEEARRVHAREVEVAAFKAAEEARMIQEEEEARAARETLAHQRELEASRAAEEARLNQEREAKRAQEALVAQQAIEARNAQIAAEEARELERIAELRRNEEAEARRATEESERVREMKRISVEQETTSAEENIRQVEEDRTFIAGSDEQALQSSLPCSFPEYPSHHIYRFPSDPDDDNEPISQTVNLQHTEDGVRGRSQGIRHDELTVKVDQSRSRSSSSSSRGYDGRESVGSSDSGRQSRYHSPNADVRIDNIISHPKDLPSVLPPQPSGLVNDSPTDAERPLLNIIRPTPEVSPARSGYISNDLDAIQEQSEQADGTKKIVIASETEQQQQQQSSSAESPSSPKHRRWFSGNVFGSDIIGTQRMKRSLAKDETESECIPVVSGPEETPATEGLELVPPAGEEDVISDIDESHESVPAYEPSSPIASHSSRSVSGEVSIDAKLRGTNHDADPVTGMLGGLGDIEFSATLAAGLKMSGLDDSLATHESMHQCFIPPGHDPQLEPWRPSSNNESISHSRPVDVPQKIAPAQDCPSENPADKNLGSVTSTPMSTGSDPNAWGNSWRSEDPKRLSRAEQRAKRRREIEKAQKTQAATIDSKIAIDGSSDIEFAVDSPSTSTDNFQDAVSAVSVDTIHQQETFLDNADIPSKDVGSVDTTEHSQIKTEGENSNEDVSVTAARPASSGSESRSVVCLTAVDPVLMEPEAEPTAPKSPPLIGPAVAPQRQVKPAIDPSYGDLLLLPPSDPNSPEISPVQENLPPLPDSRPETPPEERRTSNPAAHHRRKSSAFDTPTRSPSSTAFPIMFRSARAGPDSPAAGHCSSPSASPTLSRRSRHSSVDRTIRGTGTLIPLVLPPLTRHEHQTSFSFPEGDASVDALSSARRSRSKSDFQKSASSFDFSMNSTNPNRISEGEQQTDNTGQPASMDLSSGEGEIGFDSATMGLRPLLLDQEILSSSSTAKVDADTTTELAPTSSRPGSRRMSGPLAFGLGIEHSGFVRHSAQLDTDVDDDKPETIEGAYEVSDSLSRPVTPTMPIEVEPLEAHGTETEVVPVSPNVAYTPDPATVLGDVTIELELTNDELSEFPEQSDPAHADSAHSGIPTSPDLACQIPLPTDLDEDFAETAAEARPSEVTPSETEDDFQDAVSYSDAFTKGVSASIVLPQSSEPSRSPPTAKEPHIDAPSIVSPTLTDPDSPNLDDNGLGENTATSPNLSKKEKKRRKKARKAAAAITTVTAPFTSTVSTDNPVAIETSVVEEGHKIESTSLAIGKTMVLVEEDREASDTVASYELPVTATSLGNDKSEVIPSECPTFDGTTAGDSTGKELIEGDHYTPKVDDFSEKASFDLAPKPSFRELKSGDGLRESHEQENASYKPDITTTGEPVILHDPLTQGLEPAAISEVSLEQTLPFSDLPPTALEIRSGQIDRNILEDKRVVEPSTKIGRDSTDETQTFYEAPKAKVGSVPEEAVVHIDETPTLMEHTAENLQVVLEPGHKDYSIEASKESVYDSGIISFAERGLSPVVEEVEEDFVSVVHDSAGPEYPVQLSVVDVESVVDRGIVAEDIPLPESPVSESTFMDESLIVEKPVHEINVRSTVEHAPLPIPEAADEALLPANQYDSELKAVTQTSVLEDKPNAKLVFVSPGFLDIEDVSGVDKTHKLEEAPVFQTTPAVDDAQIADKALIVEESLVAEETPAFEATPIFHEAQVVENTHEDQTDSRVATHILGPTEAFGSVHEAALPPAAESMADTSSGFAHTQGSSNINVESTSAIASDESVSHLAGTLDPKSQQIGDVGDITDDVSSCIEQPEALGALGEAAYGEKSVPDGTPHVSTEGPSTQPVVDMILKLAGEIPTVHDSVSLVTPEDALVENNVCLNMPEKSLDYQPQATPEIHNANVSVEIKTPLVEETLLQPEASDVVVEELVSTPKFLETSVVPVDGPASESVAQSSLKSFAQSPQSDNMEQALSQSPKVMTSVLSRNTSEASVYDVPPLPVGDDDELAEGPNIKDIPIGLLQETAHLELQDSDTLDIQMPDAIPSQEVNFMVQEDTALPGTDAKADIKALVPPEPEAICEADITTVGTETDHNLTPRARASVPATNSINPDTEPDFDDLISTGTPGHSTPAMTNPQSQLPMWTGLFSAFNKPGQIAGNLILPSAGAPALEPSQPPSPSVDTTVGDGASEDDVGSVTSSHVQEDDEQSSEMPVERLRKGLPPPSSVLLGHKSWATIGAHRHIRGLAPSSSSTPTDKLSPELATHDLGQAASTAAGSVDGDVESINSPIETVNTDAIFPEVHISTQPDMLSESPLDGLLSRETLESSKLETTVSAVDVTSERAATIGETMFADAQQLPSFTPSLDSVPTFMTPRPHEPMADSTSEFVDGDFVDRNPTVSAPHVLEDRVSAALDVLEPSTIVSHNDVDSQTVFPHEPATRPASQLSQIIADSVLEPFSHQSPLDERYTSTEPLDSVSLTSNVDPVTSSPKPALVAEPGFDSPVVKDNDTSFSSAKAALSEPDFNADPIRVKTPSLDLGIWTGGIVKAKSIGTRWRNKALRKNHANAVVAMNASDASGVSGM
ncbi:hypothetical protein Cpir12675_005825 [Ceratocystis pirilliformis]|uniref:Uncharacterized protein n=1 Tax=Ceratocystis pirilliformis TaxID=259994 RepID=A0ABR3YMD1_9PEZI